MTQKITSLTRSNIDALKQEVDLREKVRKQCVNLELRPYKDGLVGCCPFHNDEHPSFYVYHDWFYCFGCGKSGDIFSWLMYTKAYGFLDAVREIAAESGKEVSDDFLHQIAESVKAREKFSKEAKRYQNILEDEKAGRVARDYLMRRGLTLDTISHFELGYDPANKNSITIPLYDINGNIVGITRRSTLQDPKMKYWTHNNNFYKKENYIYNLFFALKEPGPLYVCEGQFDAMSIWQAGFHKVVATCGGIITESQIRQLVQYSDHIILVPDVGSDNDWNIFRKNVANIRKVAPDIKIEAVVLPNKDANETPQEVLGPVLSVPQSAEIALLDIVVTGTNEEQYDRARRFLKVINDPLVKDDIIQRLAKRWKKPQHLVEQSLLRTSENRITAVYTADSALNLLKENELAVKERTVDLQWPGLEPYVKRIRGGHCVCVMARTGVGKTMTLLNLLLHTYGNITQVFFTMEQPVTEIVYRLATMGSHQIGHPLSTKEIENLLTNSEEDERWEAHHQMMTERFSSLRLIDQRMSVEEIKNTVATIAEDVTYPIGIIWIDYLGIIKSKAREEYERVSQVANDLFELAGETGAIVVYAHQLSRAGGSGTVPVTLDMGRGSGVVEESVDLCIGLYRATRENEDINFPEQQKIMVQVLKNRHGPKGDFEWVFCTDSLRIHLPEYWIPGPDGISPSEELGTDIEIAERHAREEARRRASANYV